MTTTIVALIGAAIIFALIWLWATSGTFTCSWSMSEASESVGIAGQSSKTYTDGNDIIDSTVLVPASTTDQLTETYIKGSGVRFLVMVADKDLTLKINNSGTPTDTITLKAGVAWHWSKDSGIPFPITGTAGVINKIYSTNAASGSPANDATLRIRGLQLT